MGQKFELEKMGRVIDSTTDLKALQGLCKQLLGGMDVPESSHSLGNAGESTGSP
jgi:hypothetical protein